MTDYASFKYGATTYPLPVGNGIGGVGASLLRDCDAPLFYLLEFYTAVLQRHIGQRLLAEAASCGANQIATPVADVLPFNPEPYLTEEYLRFPLLTAERKSSKFEFIGGQKHSVSDVEVCYVLPPLQAGEAERLIPILHAVANVIDNRTEQGMDPSYAPTASTAGALVWTLAGVASAGVTHVDYGSLNASDDLFFPCVILRVELKERSDVALTEFENFNGANVDIDLKDPVQETTVSDFIEFSTLPAPTLTVATPNTGTKAGGTSVTLTGTGFIVGTTPTITFGGRVATSVVVNSATSLTCVTPAHDAYTTFIADVEIDNTDGQSGELVAGFTFTSP